MRRLASFIALLFAGAAHAAGPGSGVPPGIVSGNTNVPSYHGAIVGLAATAAGDAYCVQGSATKTVKIKKMTISVTATAAIVGDVSVVLRSSADSGGTPTAITIGRNDPLNDPPTATATAYSAAPTPGTLVSTARAHKLEASTQGASAISGDVTFDFSSWYDQPLVLRGTTQFACILTSAFGTGSSFNIDHEHTEE